MKASFSIRQYLRDVSLPFCAGCGGLTVLSEFLQAVHELGYVDLQEFVFCSGIGCAAWIPSPHFVADSIHTMHGRSIPVATGIKLLRPHLNVVVMGGDGDIAGIGLSHLIHAARRNLDILVVMVNNMVYGMTGGQVAPTTPLHTKTITTPYGSFEPPLNTTELVVTAGASYASRWTTAHRHELRSAIIKAIKGKGFRFIEVVSQCPTAYGRKMGFKNPGEMVKWLKKTAISKEQAEQAGHLEISGKIVVGEFINRKRHTLGEALRNVIEEAQKDAEKN